MYIVLYNWKEQNNVHIHHKSYNMERHFLLSEFESRSCRGVFDTTLCDKVCQCLATGWWFSLGTPVSSTNKTYIYLKYYWKWH